MKLNIGGEEKKDGWKVLNIQKKEAVDYIGDITDLSQFEDNSIDEIYASHVIEHVTLKNVQKTFKGIHRILKDNGKFYISVPDMDILCKVFTDPKAPTKVKFHIMRIMFGGQIDDFDYHYVGWNYTFMKEFLFKTGFKKTERVESFSLFKDTSDYAPYGAPISLNIIAYK
jgi:predicted SAM-dependent methyltransferase